MSKRRRARFVALTDLLARHRPDLDVSAIAEGRVRVDGSILTNPLARVRADASLRVLAPPRLRGDVKLSYAIDAFGVVVHDRVAVDVGASAGGFTTALLVRGARRVYAVDVGVGQLVGRLRIDPRVVNLEGHNLAQLTPVLIPDVAEVITIDVSYLALADAVPQLEPLTVDARADLVALVKPAFELRRPELAAGDHDVADAVAVALHAITRSGWTITATCDAPATGRGGAREVFIHATRARP
jgi:23S rRNA (cytidine1920-2'-O)/16S rRNA (cytidine1409-2'-O)-methyltransferase